jgi:DNA-binding transcriptional MerR regulator
MERTEKRLLKIGEVARLTGFPVRTLRYYEKRGLLEPAARTESGYRLYGEEEVARLEFIKRAKSLGLKLEEITELVDLAAESSRGKVIPRLEDVLEAKLEETGRRMAELAAFQESLLYYRRRLFEIDPVENCGCEEGVSFCGCLEAVTGGEPLIGVQSLRRERYEGGSRWTAG